MLDIEFFPEAPLINLLLPLHQTDKPRENKMKEKNVRPLGFPVFRVLCFFKDEFFIVLVFTC